MLSMLLIASIMMIPKVSVAGDVDSKKARQVGAYFMASQFGSKAITDNSLKQVYEIPNMERNIPALYVFNTADERGFVIVAGSDCIEPIVAYSTEGAFDPNNIPPNMLWWLNGQAADVILAQNNELEPAAESISKWDELLEKRLPYFGAKSKDRILLLTSKWNQEPLYNEMCPSDANGKSVTGCVATAMAQIIYYWRYPRKGYDYHSYYWNHQYLEVDFSEQYYDYDKMVDALDNTSTQEQINEVAKLSYHCGVSVDMSYSSEASGASSDDVIKAYRNYFKYVKDSLNFIKRTNARYYNANSTTTPNYKDTLWVEDIKAEILKRRPVYYAGHDVGNGTHAGHAFVCDGWNPEVKTMHFNWGWGGSGDCWCNVYKSKLKPSQGSLSGYNFTTYHEALLGITPPADSIQFVGINEVENPFTAEVYPNPASSQVTVSYSLDGNSDSEMQILDLTGKVVYSTMVSPASYQVTLPVSSLRPGVYFCRLQGHSKKFIVK